MEKLNQKKIARWIFAAVISNYVRTGKKFISSNNMIMEIGITKQRMQKYVSNPKFLEYLQKMYCIKYVPMNSNKHLKKFEIDVNSIIQKIQKMEKD